jgi:hypothetical protein
VSLVLASCVDRALDDSSVQFMALAEHALADIPLEFLTLAKLLFSALSALELLWLVESMVWWSTLHDILRG